MSKIVGLDEYKGTQIEKSYETQAIVEKTPLETANLIAERCNDNFSKSVVTEEELNKAFDQLDGILGSNLEKSEPTMSFERQGELGSYSYSLIEKAHKGDEEYDEDMEKGMKYKGEMYKGKGHEKMYKEDSDYKKAYDKMEGESDKKKYKEEAE